MPKTGYVYIMTNWRHTVLYTGVTSNLARRVEQHREGDKRHFTGRYRVKKLVYFETCEDMMSAIDREKQLKAGSRQDKVNLIVSMNPEWGDLSGDPDWMR
jgi:putative endonuclease